MKQEKVKSIHIYNGYGRFGPAITFVITKRVVWRCWPGSQEFEWIPNVGNNKRYPLSNTFVAWYKELTK